MRRWTHYNPDDFKETTFELIPEGIFRGRIEKAEDTVTHNEPPRNMVKLTISVSVHNNKLWSYIILDDSDDEAIKKTNQTLGTFFNSFGIEDNTMDSREWIGKIGGVRVRHKEDAHGIKRAEVAYFLYAKEIAKLPAWQEGKGSTINPDNTHNIPF